MADRISTELQDWQEKYRQALARFAEDRANFTLWMEQFNGDKKIDGLVGDAADATSVYNFTRELIESQVDSILPAPSITPRRADERNRDLADTLCAVIRSEMDRMPMESMNDLDERICRIMGGDVFLTEWDNAQKTHATVGEIANRLVSPLEFIPQEAVYDISRMDHFFLAFEETKDRIESKYNVSVENETIDSTVSERDLSAADDLVTQIVCFYKKSGDIGCISWVGDTELFNEKNYFARKDYVCVKCGKTKADGEKECICGSTEWEKRDRDYETLKQDIARSDGTIIPAMSPVRVNGELVMEDYEEPVIDPATRTPMYNRVLQDGVVVGEEPMMQTKQRPAMEPTRIPYYKPKDFPIALRRNVSVFQKFFGASDCAVIRDQQQQANKAMTKIDRKISSTSEFFTKPADLSFDLTNNSDTTGVLNVDKVDQIAMIQAISLKFDMVSEYNVIEQAYYQSKSMLGVTDTFQGKTDPTATSGKAKEIQVAQAAGIQKSKRVMKNAAYADMFRNMFWFMLAFADEPRIYTTTDYNGQQVEKVFSRYDFLKQDNFGNWYYDDEYTFSVDEAGAMQTDKQFLMEDARIDFNMGAFGNPEDPQTMLMYWEEKKALGYPNAKRMVKHWEQLIERMIQMQEQQQAIEEEAIAAEMAAQGDKGGAAAATNQNGGGTV